MARSDETHEGDDVAEAQVNADDWETRYSLPAEPQHPLNLEKEEVIIDLRAMHRIPFDLNEDGMGALRVAILPKGRSLHVPGQAGRYIVGGSWRHQYALCIVHWIKSTARLPELCIGFFDYGMLNPSASGIFVETLQLPLMRSNRVFEDCPRTTKLADVAGFSDIFPARAPWATQLAPALEKQALFKRLGISKPADIQKLNSSRLATRITKLEEDTRAKMEAAVADIRRQDTRMADKQLAKYEATLTATLGALKALPPSAYDCTLGDRIVQLVEGDAAALPVGFPPISSPSRKQVAEGGAELIRTVLARRERRTEPVAEGEKQATVLSEDDDDDDDNGDSDDDDDDADNDARAGVAKEASPVYGKRKRKATAHFEPTVKPTKAKTAKTAKTAAAAKEPKPPKKTVQTGDVADDPVVINVRTGNPYVRGGPYMGKSPTLAGARSAAEPKSKTGEKNEGAVPLNKEQSKEILSLKEELKQCKANVLEQKQNQALLIAAAKVEAASGHAAALLAEYKVGLKDGAKIATGKIWELGTPQGSSSAQSPI